MKDNQDGMFVPLDGARPDHAILIAERAERLTDEGIFKVGDEVVVRGARFRVATIGPKRLTLKLLPRATGPQEDAP